MSKAHTERMRRRFYTPDGRPKRRRSGSAIMEGQPTTQSTEDAMKVLVLAETAAGYIYAIPADDVGDRVERLKDQIEAHGWAARGTVFPLSRADFQRMRRARAQEAK